MTRRRAPFALRRPCATCPFTRSADAVRLTGARVREIAANMLSPAGKSFACHELIDYGDDDEPVNADNAPHCAGALLFAERHGVATQMMRIGERLRLYDRRRLRGGETVFDSLAEMLATAIDRRNPPKRRAKRRP